MRTPLLFGVLLLAACETESNLARVPDMYGHGEGVISGRVCDPERFVWLEGATVYLHVIDSSGELRDTRKTTSDEDGYWTLDDLASGTYTVYVQYGSTTVDMFDAKVVEGRETEVPEGACSGSADVEVAVVTGDFDDFDAVLGATGISGAHDIDGQTGAELLQFLENPEEMARYDAIFFAGGHLEDGIFYSSDGSDDATVATVKENLKAYVSDGGVVFASDWSYDVVEETWPGQIEFLGGGDPDSAQLGEPELLVADVTNSNLEEALGKETVKMDHDLDAWPVVDTVGDEARVFLSADATWRQGMDTAVEKNSPLLVEFESGKGRVVFTSFRMSANIDGPRLPVIQWLMERELGD